MWLYPRIIVLSPIKICQSVWIQWPFFPKNLNQRSLTPRWPLTPSLLGSHVWLCWRIIESKSHENASKYVDTVTFFSKTWTKGHWPLDTFDLPCLLRSHVWLYSRIIVSKSHGNTSMYVDTVIKFAKYHILRTEWVITVSFWTQFRRDKK